MIVFDTLINGCKKKDRLAQKDLYGLLLPYLNVVVKRYLYNDSDRQDVLQETFINIFKSIDKYDKTKAQFKTWSVRITINCCLKNNIKRDKMPTSEFEVNQHSRLINPEVMAKLSNDDLMTFLKTMPTNYFEVFNLYVVDEFSHKEIAVILKIDISLSRKRLSRAREWLSFKTGDTNIRKMLIEKLI